MPATVELKIEVDREKLAEAMKSIPIRDVALIVFELSKHYTDTSGGPDTPRAKFGRILRDGVGLIHDGDF